MTHRPPPIKGKAWQHLSFEIRFKASFKVNKKTGCWEWTNPSSQGYGGIDYDGKTIAAHRAAWLHFKGKIPKGLCVLHSCDNRRCVNYKKHLYIGTKKQNRADFMRRHPRVKELLTVWCVAGGRAVKEFWSSLSKSKRKKFIDNRAKVQAEKRAATPNYHGPNYGKRRSAEWKTKMRERKTIKLGKQI